MNELEYIRKFPTKIDWITYSGEANMCEEFIREFQDHIFWWNLSCNTNTVLSETLIREFDARLYIGLICGTQELSEDFLREYKDELSWWRVCWHQNLSKEFIAEFIDFVNFEALLSNKKISNDVKDYVRMFV